MAKLLVAALVLVTVDAVLSAPSWWEPSSCGSDEVYKTAGPCDPVEDVCPATRPTMHMPGPYRRPCTHQLIFGCFCRKGLYRRESDRKCVPVDQC
uniref:TIL domain containing protein n=1 Tax=Rhipicephalus appendiculatus TaxID=34631 RepID=A0A131YPP9_RHIAP